MAPIPGSSYSHKNMRKVIYFSLISDNSEELPALTGISKYFFCTLEVTSKFQAFATCEKN
jgi:hypothetical protein